MQTTEVAVPADSGHRGAWQIARSDRIVVTVASSPRPEPRSCATVTIRPVWSAEAHKAVDREVDAVEASNPGVPRILAGRCGTLGCELRCWFAAALPASPDESGVFGEPRPTKSRSSRTVGTGLFFCLALPGRQLGGRRTVRREPCGVGTDRWWVRPPSYARVVVGQAVR